MIRNLKRVVLIFLGLNFSQFRVIQSCCDVILPVVNFNTSLVYFLSQIVRKMFVSIYLMLFFHLQKFQGGWYVFQIDRKQPIRNCYVANFIPYNEYDFQFNEQFK